MFRAKPVAPVSGVDADEGRSKRLAVEIDTAWAAAMATALTAARGAELAAGAGAV